MSKVKIMEKRRKSEIIAQNLLYSNIHAKNSSNEFITPISKNSKIFFEMTPKSDINFESRMFLQASNFNKSERNIGNSTIIESLHNESVSDTSPNKSSSATSSVAQTIVKRGKPQGSQKQKHCNLLMKTMSKRISADTNSELKQKPKIKRHKKKLKRDFSLEKFKFKPSDYWSSKPKAKSNKRSSYLPGSTFIKAKEKWMLINGEMVKHNPVAII